MASKAFFSIEFQGGAELIRELSAVELELKKVQDQIKAAQKAGDGDAYKNLRVQQEDLKRSSAELRKEIKAQATAFEKAQFPKDSLIGLEQQYSSLRAEIRGFSKDYRESAAGIAKIRLADSLKSQILEIDNSIKDFKSNIGNYKSGLSSLSNVGDIITGGLVTGGITAAIGAVVAFGKESVAAFKESEIAITAVDTAVTTTGKAAGFTVEQLAQEAENLMKNTVFDDDQILKDVTSQLLTFTNVTGDTFLRAQKSALDLNTVLGGDLQGTTIQLGKALENPIKGVTALSKAGVTFTEQQKAQIKTLVESNKVQEAQAIILDEINAKYGNQAEALANTDTGKLQQASNILGELQEKLGGFIVSGLAKLAPLFNYLIDGVGKSFDFIYDNVIEPVSEAFSRFFSLFGDVTGGSKLLDQAFEILGNRIDAVVSVVTTLIDYITDTIGWFKKLGSEVPFVGKVFDFLGDRISSFVQTIIDIPAYFAATLKGIAQFVSNVRNLDFSKSALDAAKTEFDRLSRAGFIKDLEKSIDKVQDKIEKFNQTKINANVDKAIQEATSAAKNALAELDADTKKLEAKVKAQKGQRLKDDIAEEERIKKSIEATNSKLDEKINKLIGGKARVPTNGLANKEGDAEKKLTDDQLKRISDIQNKIKELTNAKITNEFDKQIEELRRKAQDTLNKLQADSDALDAKKVKTANDIKESDLIKQETELIKANLKTQVSEVEAKRAEAYATARKQLKDIQDSNLATIKKAGAEELAARLDIINADDNLRQNEIELRYTIDTASLQKKLDEGLITQKQFDEQLKGLQSNFNEEKLSAEKDAAAERLKIYDVELARKIEVLKIESEIAKGNIDEVADARRARLKEDLDKGKIEAATYQSELTSIDEKAALDKEKITLSTEQKERIEQAKTADLKIQANEAIAKSDDELAEQNKANAAKRLENAKAILNASLDIAGQISDALFGAAQDNADREKDARLASLEAEYEKRFEAAKGNATLEAGLKKQLEEEKNAIEKKAFEENKKRQIAQAIINGALAITNILATVPKFDFGIASAIQVAVTAASTAIQIATIKNAKFARGGFTGIGNGAPDETGHVPVGVVHANEWVANPEMVRDNPELFQRLEYEQATKYRRATHKKLFADGGFTSAIPDVIGINKVAQQKQSAAVFSNEQIDAIADRLAAKTYEAVKAGSMEGTKDGVYTGQNEVNRLRERQDVLATNSTF